MNISTLPFISLLLAIASTPWNAIVFANLRLNDIFLISAFLLSVAALKVSKTLTVFLSIVIVTIFLSILVNVGAYGASNFDRITFLYKYSAPFLVAIAFVATAKTLRRLMLTEVFLMVTFLVLVGWVYYYKIAVDSGSIIGLSRVSFPGSSDFLISDAHLYSNYLAMGLIFYLLHLKHTLNHSAIIASAIVMASIGALILTGSRNGILSLTLAAALWGFLLVASGEISIRKSAALKFPLYFFVVAAIASSFYAQTIEFLSDAMERALNFNFSIDASAASRVEKFSGAISDWASTSLLLGAGLFGARLTWYDSGLGIILVHMGLSGLGIAILGISYFIFAVARKHGINTPEARATLTIIIVYAFANGITEFALVTRNVLPVTLFIAIPIVSKNIRENTREGLEN